MPAARMKPARRRDLLTLDHRLSRDRRNFRTLLGKIRRDVFVMHNGNIVLNPQYYSKHDIDHSPVFAFLDEDNQLQIKTHNNTWREPEDVRLFSKKQKQHPSGSLTTLDDQALAFFEVPPLSWITDVPQVSGAFWTEMLQALIRYSLMNWAIQYGFDGSLPQPDYEHLSRLFWLLMKTQHYKQLTTVKESDDEFVYVPKSVYGTRGNLEPETTVDEHESMNDGSAPTSQGEVAIRDDDDQNERHLAMQRSQSHIGVNAVAPGTSPLACPSFNGPTSPRDLITVSSATQQDRITVEPRSSTDIENATSLNVDTHRLRQEPQLNNTRQHPYPTPDAAMSDEITPEVDQALASLHAKLGHDLLSLLPELRQMAFQKITQIQPGFLPLRMQIGTYKSSAGKRLSGNKVWISYKVHDKDGRSAPRMLTQAFHVDTDELVSDSLKFTDMFPLIVPIPAFSNIRNNFKGEMHFKAIAKYYFILAANARLHGFKDHLMPANDTFIGDLRTVCMQLQKIGSVEVDSDSQAKGPPRKRRRGKLGSRLPSTADDEFTSPIVITQVTKRTSRRFQEVTPDVTSDNSGVSTPVPEYLNSFRQVLPRKFALGTPVFESKGSASETVNGFLDPDTDATDSDGDSGDEIPIEMPPHIQRTLDARLGITQAIACHREGLKFFNDRKDQIKYSMRYNKGRLTRGTAHPEAANAELKLQEQQIAILQTRISTHDGALRTLKDKKKEMDKEVGEIDGKWVGIWEAKKKEVKNIEKEERLQGTMGR